MLISVLVYVFRVLRWQMLIKTIGYETKFSTTFSALSIGYFVNFALPRFGEITRCLSVKKQHDIPFMELLGTVIIERVIDVVSLIIVLLLTLILQANQVLSFCKQNIFEPIYNGIILKLLQGNMLVYVVLFSSVLIIILLFFYFQKYLRTKYPNYILQFIKGLKQGLASIAKLKDKKLFLLYTFFIWLCYYLMTFFWFFVFSETSALSFGACLTILAIGSVGRSIPIQGGGMGAYHFLVTQVVMLYGVSEMFSKTLATLIHAGQTFFTFAMGLVGFIIFFINYWKNNYSK